MRMKSSMIIVMKTRIQEIRIRIFLIITTINISVKVLEALLVYNFNDRSGFTNYKLQIDLNSDI